MPCSDYRLVGAFEAAAQRAGNKRKPKSCWLTRALDNTALKDLRCYAEDATLTLMARTRDQPAETFLTENLRIAPSVTLC
jgi:hypothetical protein